MAPIPAAQLAPILNAYTVRMGPPKTIIVPHASAVAALQDVTVAGTLLKKQVIVLDPGTGQRTVHLGANNGAYSIEADGDLHFCLGTAALQPHVTCELQHGTPSLNLFNASTGQPITATGVFRCLFEHPGFASNDDAHIFELHPVRGVTLGGQTLAFPVDLPDPGSIHAWTFPHPLNAQDDRIRVAYDSARDTLTFTDMDGQDENYVRVAGTASNVQANPTGGALASFTLASPDIGHPIQVVCAPGTNAAVQLQRLAKPSVTLVALRSIDLQMALSGRYVIRLLAIDIQS